jgi:hypothetical protein
VCAPNHTVRLCDIHRASSGKSEAVPRAASCDHLSFLSRQFAPQGPPGPRRNTHRSATSLLLCRLGDCWDAWLVALPSPARRVAQRAAPGAQVAMSTAAAALLALATRSGSVVAYGFALLGLAGFQMDWPGNSASGETALASRGTSTVTRRLPSTRDVRDALHPAATGNSLCLLSLVRLGVAGIIGEETGSKDGTVGCRQSATTGGSAPLFPRASQGAK